MKKQDRLRMARRSLRLTQREVAERVSVSVSTYRSWEGSSEPGSLNVAARLCRVLCISLDWYINGEEFKQLSDEQLKVVRHYDQLGARQKQGFLDYINTRKL
ncbi:MAG: helix-turn-helix domain-containing protein [Pseudomonadales bacterium]